MTASASSNTAHRIEGTAAFFIPHLVSRRYLSRQTKGFVNIEVSFASSSIIESISRSIRVALARLQLDLVLRDDGRHLGDRRRVKHLT